MPQTQIPFNSRITPPPGSTPGSTPESAPGDTLGRVQNDPSGSVPAIESPYSGGNSGGTSGGLSREQILQATFVCLHDKGFEATTIRQIAKQLDCAIGSIYRYFRDKHDLLYVVTQELLEPVAAGLAVQTPLQRSVAMYANLASSDLQSYRLMFWLACNKQNHADALPTVVRSILNQWTDLLDSKTQAQTLWAMLHGLLLLEQDQENILRQLATWLDDQEHPTLERPESPIEPEIVIFPRRPQPIEDITLL